MTEPVDSTQVEAPEVPLEPNHWARVGAIAVFSAFAGGLAAAWYYRKTLAKLRAAGEMHGNEPVPPKDEDEA